MIITVTLNPAVDQNISADQLVFDDRAYILDTFESAGGRGINASRVIHSFGGKTLAIAFSGGESGTHFEQLLKKYGFPAEFVRMKNAIRHNLAITDKQGLSVKLNERGPDLSGPEVEAIAQLVIKRLPKAKWLMLCGSLPPGVPNDFYSQLIEAARKEGVKTLLDTDSDPLTLSVEAGPTVVTPNQSEAERLLGRALLTRSHFIDAAERIREMGSENVLLSLGARGAIGCTPNHVYEAIPPRVDAVCPIGAGDAMAAAFTWAMTRGKPFADAIRWGVAAGTASAMLPGISYPTLDQTKDIYKRVEIKPVS
ncbi:1-phosphofructokinase family hexose kinase [Bryobacter aggregatus]|uniref:1-phosphofructokinase family hexose kinase n=1 Tax=Bryobacter aggregatus TaxID=360054 RepID=UPI0004E14D29|nr:1-phosphofructokinase family hexose kinase [Bryobacter aggregatus]